MPPHAANLCWSVGGGVVPGAERCGAQEPTGVLGTFTGCFLNFVSPRIMKEIRSIPTARLGGEVLRELSEAAVNTSDPLPLVASSIWLGGDNTLGMGEGGSEGVVGVGGRLAT